MKARTTDRLRFFAITGLRAMRAALVLVLAALLPTISPASPIDPKLLPGLKARLIGPAAMSGRLTAIDAVNTDPDHLVIGAANGGVWKSLNGGLSWTPIFDGQPVASIGAVAINQKNPKIIWVGTGESNVRNSVSIGRGVFKTVDGGKSWSFIGLGESEHIGRIVLHPDDPDIAYVAALGTLWSANEERGLYKTVNGGATWSRMIYVDENTGAADIKMDPANPRRLLAAMWQFRRWPYRFESGGPGSGVYLSEDGGESWKDLTEADGLPAGPLGNTVFSFAPSDPNRVYALIEAKESALAASDDGGRSWRLVNRTANIAERPYYFSEVAVDPRNKDRIYNIATRVQVSDDGGRTFSYLPAITCCAPSNTIHVDHHAFWINPRDPEHIVTANDGGLAISRDAGQTWRFVSNLPVAQFYHIAVDDDHPYNVYGGTQDNGSGRLPAEIWEAGGIRNLHWQSIEFGDNFELLPDPRNSQRGYSMQPDGLLSRWNLATGELHLIRPAPKASNAELRFNWNAAFAIDPFKPDTIYVGSQFVHRSHNRGDDWSILSGDLTSDDPKLQRYTKSGGLTPDTESAHTTLTVIAPSAVEEGVIWTGSDDGRVHVTRNGGDGWRRIDMNAPGLPVGAWTAAIAPSPHEPDVAFIAFDDHRRGNMNPYVYRIEDFGERWIALHDQSIDGYALSILQDHVNPQLLFLGTEFGLYVSTNGGAEWFRFAGMPTTSVMDVAMQKRESDLVIGTHGRSIYIIDDYTALRWLRASDFDRPFHLLSVTNGQQYAVGPPRSTRFTGDGEFRGENEPYGVLLTFMVGGANAAKEGLTTGISIVDAQGEIVRRFRQPVTRGVNRIVWNLTRDGVRPVGAPEADILPQGPEVPPGKYGITVVLENADGGAASGQFSTTAEVIADPRSAHGGTASVQRYHALVALDALEDRANRAMERISEARDRVDAIDAEIRAASNTDSLKRTLLARGDRIKASLAAFEGRISPAPYSNSEEYLYDVLLVRSWVARRYIGTALRAPSANVSSYMAATNKAYDTVLAELDAFLKRDVASFSSAARDAGFNSAIRTGRAG